MSRTNVDLPTPTVKEKNIWGGFKQIFYSLYIEGRKEGWKERKEMDVINLFAQRNLR